MTDENKPACDTQDCKTQDCKIKELKAEVFDILSAIDQHRLAIQKLDQLKAERVNAIVEIQNKAAT